MEAANNEEAQLIEMRRLNAELDKSAKLLIRRDLELGRASEKLKQVDKMKSEFVSLVTHQLRTPLSGIKWSLSILLNGDVGPLSPEQRAYLSKTYESNERMIALINDLLQADRLESGIEKFSLAPTQLEPLAKDIIDQLQPLAMRKKTHIALKVETALPPIMADAAGLSMALQNLIDNAIKYSPQSSVVTVTLKETDTKAEIIVEDHGIGIPPEAQPRIFSRFFRARNALLADAVGSGLGLYIAAEVVRKHNGDIRFETAENKGTMFTISLPKTA